MAQVKPIVIVELDPLRPVPEALAVISALLPYNPSHETEILEGVRDAITQRLDRLKGAEQNAEQIRESERSCENQ